MRAWALTLGNSIAILPGPALAPKLTCLFALTGQRHSHFYDSQNSPHLGGSCLAPCLALQVNSFSVRGWPLEGRVPTMQLAFSSSSWLQHPPPPPGDSALKAPRNSHQSTNPCVWTPNVHQRTGVSFHFFFILAFSVTLLSTKDIFVRSTKLTFQKHQEESVMLGVCM